MDAHVPWYLPEAGFFGPQYLAEYGSGLTQERTRKEVDFLEEHVFSPCLTGGWDCKNILDVPCGHGRHSVELARRRYGMNGPLCHMVWGQDLNGFFLMEARAAAKKLPNVKLALGDMRRLRFPTAYFDVVLNLFTAFGYLESDDEDQKALDAVAKTLKRGGKFVLDVINRD